MKKNISKILIAVFAVLGIFQIASLFGNQAEASSRTTTVNIHKVESGNAAADTEYNLGTGLTQEEYAQTFGSDAKKIPGITFEVFKVDDASAFSTENTVEEVKAVDPSAESLGQFTTGQDGVAQVPSLKDGDYWVIELTPSTVTGSAAVPFALTLPYTNTDGTGYFETINVYPKNTLTEDRPTVEKTLVAGETNKSVNIGDEIEWIINSDVPVGIDQYITYEITDVLDSQLDYIEGSTTITSPNGLVQGNDYTVNFDKASNTLVVALTESGIAALTSDDTLTISLKTKVNETAEMGKAINNSASLDFENKQGQTGKTDTPTPPSVVTGGKKFAKVDGEEKLQEAEFKIKNSNGEYVVVVDGNRSYTTNQADATVFTSDKNGEFEITGLAFGEYTLEEIKAPEGYVLPTNPNTNFTIDANSYTNEATLSVPNTKITIPQTGGIGTLLFAVAGAALMIFAVLYYRKSEQSA